MRRSLLVLGSVVVLGLIALLASQAVERDEEYLALIVQGDAALGRGETFVAIEAYSEAIALKRDSMLAYLKRGEAHQRRGDGPETLTAALRDLRTAAALAPESTQTLEKLGDVNYQLRRFANAVENYEAYLRLDDQNARLFYKLALASRAGGQLDRAATALQKAIDLNPAFHEAHYVLGLCLRDRDQLGEARGALEKAIAISPAFIPAREELAEIHRIQARPREELDQLDALYALDPVKAERLIAVGLAYLRAGDRALAVATLGKAADKFPDHAGVYVALGQVWLETAEDTHDPTDIRKAIEALEPIAAQSTANSEVLGLYGRALMLAGQTAKAESIFQQAAQRYPIDADVLPYYASAAQRLGHLQDARAALVKYSALIDDDREQAARAAWIGDLSAQLNDSAGAIAWYQRSETLGGSDSALLARLAEAHARAGHIDEARATAQRALEKDPENPSLQSLSRRLQR